MATIKDIANRLGVSISTVSKGLNGASDISAELRQTILDTAVEMGYVTKRMKKEEHKRLCIFIENVEYESASHFGYDIILGFKQAAYRDNWHVEVLPVTPEFQNQEKYDTYMLRHGYSGAFLVGFSLQDPWIDQIADTTIPTVLFDNSIHNNPNVAYVGTDSYEGIDAAIDHLAKLGHTKIAFLNGSLHSMITEDRQQAFCDSMTSHQLEVDDNLIANSYYQGDSARDYVPVFLENNATAIICGNDMLAYGVLKECERCGYQVPDDVSVVGFDDLPLSSHTAPALTTVRQERSELGKCGYMALHSLMEHVSVSKTLLRPQFIIRNSTAKAVDR
jgi:LacI family transcriptional regulator